MRDGDGAGEEFDTIRQIDIKPGVDKELPTFSITLANGKSGQFTAALLGSFRGARILAYRNPHFDRHPSHF